MPDTVSATNAEIARLKRRLIELERQRNEARDLCLDAPAGIVVGSNEGAIFVCADQECGAVAKSAADLQHSGSCWFAKLRQIADRWEQEP